MELTTEETTLTDVDETVIVGKAPRFLQPLEPTQVEMGRPVHLTVTVTAEPPPTFTWYYEGRKIEETDQRFRIISRGTTSTLTTTEETIIGEYTVVAKNEYGQAASTAPIRPAKGSVILNTYSSLSYTVCNCDTSNFAINYCII